MDMVLQGDKNGVFSDVCGYDGKRVSDRRRWKCGIPQGECNAGFWREGHGCGRGYM